MRVALLYGLKAAYAVCMLCISIVVGRYWGSESLGLLGVSLTLVTIAVAFGSFGGQYRGVEVGSKPSWESGGEAWPLVVQSAACGFIGGLLLFLIGHAVWGVSLIVAVCAAAGSVLGACGGIYIGAGRQVLSSIFDNGARVIGSAVMLGAAIVFSARPNLQNDLVLLGLFLVPSVIAVCVLARSTGLRRFGNRPFASLTAAGFLLSIFGVLEVLTAQVDRLLVGHLLGPGPVGIYTATQNILNVVLYGVVVANSLAMPRLAGISKLGSAENLKEYRKIVRLVVLFSGLVTACSPVFGHALLSLYGEAYRVGVWPLFLMLGGLTISLCFGFPMATLLLNGERLVGLALSAASVLLIVTLCFVLIPQMGFVGAAIAYAAGAVSLKATASLWAYRSLGVNTSVYSRS